jgi:hypothetical protein
MLCIPYGNGGITMKIRIPAALWAAWIVITLPIAVINLLLYITGVVEVGNYK